MPLAGPSTTLTVVQGATLTRELQGYNEDGSIPTQFLNTDTLAGTVWLAQAEPAVVNFTPTWFNASMCQVTINLTSAQTATLALDTDYNLQVFATRSGITYCTHWIYLQVLPAAGSQAAASPPDLVTGAYAAGLLQQLSLNAAQLEAIPSLITAASNAIRSWCYRRFDQGTEVETVPVEWDGTIRLKRPPINYVQRIQSQPQRALTVANRTAVAAWIYPATTGDLGNQVTTGLVLNWISGGITSQATITYVANQTITALATAIGAAGGGWTAQADSYYGAFPVTEMFDGLASKGASINDQPTAAAVFHVYGQDIPNGRFVPDRGGETGILWIDRQYDGLGPRWGPDWQQWSDYGSRSPGQVKVTYNGGFAAVPPEVQLATVELVKAQLFRLKREFILTSERAGEYSYTIDPRLVQALPPEVLQNITRYRLSNA